MTREPAPSLLPSVTLVLHAENDILDDYNPDRVDKDKDCILDNDEVDDGDVHDRVLAKLETCDGCHIYLGVVMGTRATTTAM